MRIQTPPYKLLTTTAQLLLLGSLTLYSVASFSFETAAKQTTYVTYLNTKIKTIDVTINQCVLASPSTLFEISPTYNDAAAVYHVRQIVSAAEQKKLYAIPIEEQIKHQKFISTKLCDGFASISDMSLPFAKDDTIQDANDGKLLVETTRHALAEILQNLEEMQNLAVSAANGTNGSADLLFMDNAYQRFMGDINEIATHAHFNDIYLFNGSRFGVEVPINNRRNVVWVGLFDAQPASLKIDDTKILYQAMHP